MASNRRHHHQYFNEEQQNQQQIGGGVRMNRDQGQIDVLRLGNVVREEEAGEFEDEDIDSFGFENPMLEILQENMENDEIDEDQNIDQSQSQVGNDHEGQEGDIEGENPDENAQKKKMLKIHKDKTLFPNFISKLSSTYFKVAVASNQQQSQQKIFAKRKPNDAKNNQQSTSFMVSQTELQNYLKSKKEFQNEVLSKMHYTDETAFVSNNQNKFEKYKKLHTQDQQQQQQLEIIEEIFSHRTNNAGQENQLTRHKFFDEICEKQKYLNKENQNLKNAQNKKENQVIMTARNTNAVRDIKNELKNENNGDLQQNQINDEQYNILSQSVPNIRLNLSFSKNDYNNQKLQNKDNGSNNNIKTDKNKDNIATDPNKHQNQLQTLNSLNNNNNQVENTVQQCLICFEKPPDAVNLDCGHGGLCYECAIDIMKKTGECYLCREVIQQVLQLDIDSRTGNMIMVLESARMETEQMEQLHQQQMSQQQQSSTLSPIDQQQQQHQNLDQTGDYNNEDLTNDYNNNEINRKNNNNQSESSSPSQQQDNNNINRNIKKDQK